MSEQVKKRVILEYINYFRAFAILSIVAAHTLIWGRGAILQTNIYLFSGGTFLFVFISGFLFQYLSDKFEYKTYLKKKFINVILPFIIIMLPIAVSYALSSSSDISYANTSKIFRFLICFFSGYVVNQSMWYMGMIVIFFLSAPLLLKVKKNKIFWISCVLCSFIYTLKTNRIPPPVPNIEDGLNNLILIDMSFYFKQCFYFMSAYLIGMVSCDLIKRYKNFISKNIKMIFLISLICFVFDLIEHLYIIKLDAGQQSLQKIIECILFISFFMGAENNIKSCKILNRFLKFLANYSFGIFFVHSLILNVILCHSIYMTNTFSYSKYVYKNTIHSLVFAIGLYFTVLILSILVLFVLKKILNFFKVKNTRMFIGV